jgi:hypothetical protein
VSSKGESESESQQHHSPVQEEWIVVDPSTRRREGPISKHVKFWKEDKYGYGF